MQVRALKLMLGMMVIATGGCAVAGKLDDRAADPRTASSLLLPQKEKDQGERAIVLMETPDRSDHISVAGATKQQAGASLTLAQCIETSLAQHPDLVLVAAQADAARGQLVQAGLYPNPTIAYESDDMNSPFGGAGKQGGSITQTIVTAGKLGLSSSVAARGVEVANLKAQAKFYDLVTRVRATFYDNLTAQQEVETAREVLRIAQDGLNSAEKLQKAGIVGQPDVLRAQVELEQSKVKVAIAEQHVQTSWRLLANVLGQKDLPMQPLVGSLQESIPEYDYHQIRQTMYDVSADLEAARTTVAQAEVAVQRAEAEVTPDLQLVARPFYSQPDGRTELAVGISAPLPLYNRNQGNIMAARANVAAAQAALGQLELALSERLTLAFERYSNAKKQVQAYSQKILPAAQESLRLILVAYNSGDQRNDFTTVLQAQQSLAQAKLGLVQARGELQKAVSEIEGLLQRVPQGVNR